MFVALLYSCFMPHVEANDAALDAMRLLDPKESVVMLNLLKFRDVALEGYGGRQRLRGVQVGV